MIEVVAYSKAQVKEFDYASLDRAMKLPTVWVDVTNPSDEELRGLQEYFQLHPLAIEDCILREQRPKIDEYDNNIFTVAHLLRHNHEELEVDELFIFLGDKWVITIHYGSLTIIEELKKTLKIGAPGIQRSGPDFLYYTLLDMVVDRYYPVLDAVEDRIEVLEDLVAENPTKEILERLNLVRRQLIFIRKTLWPSLEMMSKVLRGHIPQITDQAERYLRDVHDHLTRMIDLTETYRDLANSVRDLYLSSVSTTLNEIMKTLTVIATIMFPLTLITGIYGMNFQNIPELRSPYGYYYALTLMLGIAVIMLIFFRRKRWL